MNPRMWAHKRVQANVARLVDDGVTLVAPGTGWTAERDVGVGRMAEPADILAALTRLL
jgi:phosphopantothenoylcysteine decarboxylase/phosphopantothenate--cysteine ligase